jgi:hypothetical protein
VSFSLVINHTPWIPARVLAVEAMMRELRAGAPATARHAPFLNTRDFRGTDWQESKVEWALDQWRWSADQRASHHVFMTDDLHLAPGFRLILDAMVRANPTGILGLLSNHHAAPDLAARGKRWYRTNAWLVGPCYVMPHADLVRFLGWFEALPDGRQRGCKGYANDDSSVNEWVTNGGGPGVVYHPIPTIIEHRADLESTVGHGDRFSRERVSWRAHRNVTVADDGSCAWETFPASYELDRMQAPYFWLGAQDAPLLKVGE